MSMRDFYLQKFEVFNDEEFRFYEEEHLYKYREERFISVTTFIARFHEKFDTDFHSKRIAEREGVEQQVIIDRWDAINKRSNEVGSATHNWIENYFNRIWTELPNDIDIISRINKFNVIYSTHLYKLEPFLMEKRIFSKKWRIAGTMDGMFIYNGKLILIDYKTNKEFRTYSKYRKKLYYPFENYPDCELYIYSIQLSLYLLILEEYGIEVSASYLLYIGPNEGDDAKLHRIEDMRRDLRMYLDTDWMATFK